MVEQVVLDYLGGHGMWWFCFEAQVVPGNAEGHRCCRRGMNCCASPHTRAASQPRMRAASQPHTRAASLPGQGRGAWDRSWRARQRVLWGAGQVS